MDVQLKTPEVERYVDEQVKAGRFPTPEAVVEDALRRVMAEEVELTEEDIEAIKEADEQIDRGEYIEFQEFAARMRKKYGIS
jgi:Arc/MetJ-type ribon-helix-helix transcriptional regulator